MEITASNFEERREEIESRIRDADFLTFDCEFSGIGKGGAVVTQYETPRLLYSKHKANVSNFMIVQFGLCTFKYLPQTKKYQYQAYTFYIFPRLPPSLRGLRSLITTQLTCSLQTDSLDFLASQNFDFNKWIKEGVGFLRDCDAELIREEIRKREEWKTTNAASSASQDPPHIPDGVKPKLNTVLKKVREYVKDGSGDASGSEREPLMLTNLSGYERKLVYQTLENKYGMDLYLDTIESEDESTDPWITVRVCKTAEENLEWRKKRLESKLVEVEKARGFTKIINAISQSKKPLIGHNMSLDVLHTLRAFCCDLPPSWDEFKGQAKLWLPNIIDTKVLAAHPLVKKIFGSHVSLSDIMARTKEKPFEKAPVEAGEGICNYDDGLVDLQFHNAGYDSFATGTIFIQIATLLGDLKSPTRETNAIPWNIVNEYANKLHSGRCQDLPSLSLADDAVLPPRDHVFWLVSDREEWSNKDIFALFSPYGQVQVGWVDKTSAYVTLIKKENAQKAIKTFIKDPSQNPELRKLGIRIRQVTDYLAQQEELICGSVKRKESGGPPPLKTLRLDDDRPANGKS